MNKNIKKLDDPLNELTLPSFSKALKISQQLFGIILNKKQTSFTDDLFGSNFNPFR